VRMYNECMYVMYIYVTYVRTKQSCVLVEVEIVDIWSWGEYSKSKENKYNRVGDNEGDSEK